MSEEYYDEGRLREARNAFNDIQDNLISLKGLDKMAEEWATTLSKHEIQAQIELLEEKTAHAQKLFELEKANAIALNKFNRNLTDELDSFKIDRAIKLQQQINDELEKKEKEIAAKKEDIYRRELEKQKKLNPTLTPEQIEEEAALKAETWAEKQREALKDIHKFEQKLEEENQKAWKKRRKERSKELRDNFSNTLLHGTWEERKDAISSAFKNDTGGKDIKNGLATMALAISDLSKLLDKKVDDIASHQSSINTRLWGSKELGGGSNMHFQAIQGKYLAAAGASGFVRQETLMSNLESFVAKGIAHNVDQRAFLETLKDKIASTFNAADGTLLRLVRIQQQDTTAGRLGMEAALNAFLNNMYETTEYLSDVAASVRSSLEEMEALMEGAQAAEIEYQVQKWMGSMYSVGMSQGSVQSLAGVLGQIGAGDISGLSSGAGNLVIMAANNAGLSISDILTNGLDSDKTNSLMQAMVNYLAEIADSSADSRVVQQQLANVYGLKASDLRAAKSLSRSNSAIAGSSLSYSGMLGNLSSMTNSMWLRTSLGEIMTNVWDNAQYALAGSMAANPASYLLYKMASLLDATTGGIAIPAISAAGFGVDLETTVADLMRVGAMGTAVPGLLASAFGSIAGNVVPSSMLRLMGIGQGSMNVTTRGDGTVIKASSGTSTSQSAFIGNGSSSDIIDSTMAGAEETVQNKKIEAMEAEDTDIMNKVLDEHIVAIYELVKQVIDGERSFNVRVNGGLDFGLNAWTDSGSSSDKLIGRLI